MELLRHESEGGNDALSTDSQRVEKLAITRRILQNARADLDGASNLKPQIPPSPLAM